MIQLEKPTTCFDLETTGTQVSKDRIIQLGAVVLYPNGKSREYGWYINPECFIPEEATKVHGITDDMVQDYPTFKTLAPEIFALFEDHDIMGFNSNRFDLPFLHEEFARAGINWDYTTSRFIDVSVMYNRLNARTLQDAYRNYIGEEFIDAHDAAADVKATIKIFQAMYEKHELPLTVDELDIYCNYDKKRADLGGKFYYDEEGNLKFGVGRDWKDKVVEPNSTGFLRWMMTKDFSSSTKLFAQKLIDQMQEIRYGNSSKD